MAENNNSQRNNRQPSMRDLANERMRQMKADKTGESANRDVTRRPAARDAIETERSVSKKRPSEAPASVERRPSGQASSKSASSKAQSSGAAQRSHAGSESRSTSSGNASRSHASGSESARSRASESTRKQSAGNTSRSQSSGSSSKNYSSGSGARSHSSSNTRNASSRSHSSNYAPSRNVPKKKKSPVFWIGLAIYTAILLVLSFLFLKYTDNCLKKYEDSQSEHFVENYMQEFESKVKDHSLTSSDFTFKTLDLTFVDTESFMDEYISSLDSYSSFTAEKDPTSYITESPVYNIYADGNMIGKLTLKAVSQTKIFAILTIMDWGVDTVEPVCSINVTDYTFLVPEGYTPVIDGMHVPETYMTGNKEQIPEFAYVSNYIPMPEYVEYKVDNVMVGSSIKILNPEGQEVVYETNDTGNKIKATLATASAEIPEDRKEEALKMVQTYEDFNTDDLSGASHGLATVQSFLIKDSDYWNMAKQWAGGVDITFTSAHVFDDPKYSNVVVDNYAEYSDICYSVHIAFSKNMILTRTKEKISNDFDSTVFFIYYDDTDDGTDNPHWCIADMIATTK